MEAAARRMADQSTVILAQDTTEIDLTRPQQQVVGVGPLDGDTRRGVFLHPLMGFTPDGTPLGIVYAEAWTRDDESPALLDPETKRKHTPIEEKESVRWLDTYRQAREQAEQILQAEGVLFTQPITVRGRKAKVSCENRGRRQPRESRKAEVEVRAARIALRAPWRHDRKLRDCTVNVVLVTEIDPPDDDTPVEWILLTSLPIDHVEQVRTVIQYYCVRWMIEMFQS